MDSHSWIEYFRGSPTGERAGKLLEAGGCYTPTIVIAELSDWHVRQKRDFSKRLDFIAASSIVLGLTSATADQAGKIKNEVRQKYNNNFGIADAIVMAIALEIGAKVATGGYHFKPLKNVEYLG